MIRTTRQGQGASRRKEAKHAITKLSTARSTGPVHGGADPGSNPMHTNESQADRTVWKNASRHETWLDVVLKALIHCHPPAPLSKLYEQIEPHPKCRGRKHWKAKVRQTLEQSDKFIRVSDGVWDLSSQHSAKAVKKFDRRRRKRYPRRAEKS